MNGQDILMNSQMQMRNFLVDNGDNVENVIFAIKIEELGQILSLF